MPISTDAGNLQQMAPGCRHGTPSIIKGPGGPLRTPRCWDVVRVKSVKEILKCSHDGWYFEGGFERSEKNVLVFSH